jgi:ubiquinone/menaquinone biosynthesis C-methylase UbiE
MTTSAAFWDKIAEKYARQPITNEIAYQKKLQVTREHLRPDMDVLEIGCGTGSAAIAHARHVRHIRAIDFSANMLAIARGKAAEANIDNVTFQQATIETLDAGGSTFDAVLALNLLHLLEDEAAAMVKVRQLLKPGGVFISSTACLGDWIPWLRFVAPAGRWLGVIPFVNVFTARELKEGLSSAGFTITHAWRPSKREAEFIVAKVS